MSVIDDGLIAAWVPVLGQTGSRLLDRSPTRAHGSVGGMTWQDVSGQRDVLYNSGSLQPATVAANARIKRSYPFAFAGWYYFSGLNSSRSLFVTSTRSSSNNGGFVAAALSTTALQLAYADNTANTTASGIVQFTTGTGVLATGSWYHIAGVFHQHLVAEAWIDGVQQSLTQTGTGGAVVHNVNGIVIGGGTLLASTMNGYIADLRCWNRALTEHDVTQLHNGGPGFGVRTIPRRSYRLAFAPVPSPYTVTVPVATAAATAVLPTTATSYTATVPVATAAATAIAPATQSPYVVSVPVATAAATAVAPATQSPYVVSVPVATAAATAIAPSTKATYTVTVPVATATCVAVNPTMATVVDPGIAIAEATAIAPTARASYTVTVPVATAAATAVLPKTNITVTVPVATCSCTASYTVGGNHITDELGTDTLDEVDLPLEDENTSVPGTITVVVPVAICHCIAIPGQTVAGIATDFRADYEPVGATANHGISLHANYTTPSYTSWVRRSDVPFPSGVQLR